MADLTALRDEVNDVNGDWALFKETVLNKTRTPKEPKVLDTFKPKSFNKKREAKELDTFLWNIERYFKYLKMDDDESKITTTTLFLTFSLTMLSCGDTVDLWRSTKTHLVFQVSNLKPYHVDPEEPSQGESQRASPLIVTSFEREVECIMAKHEVRSKGVLRYFEYFVKWKGLPESEGNWEKEESLWQYKDYIKAFERERTT
ncbi:hypothetical protein L3X38_025116 [Prunus dulcis]|uniref:Chromo domain-containing protein n=1 Tax=Prunus dulcis TaxID=3755 RepID=A0AAD4W177_PRUDU|nr:hypothetical protein L3X38_025116 [Prunus dulcis]